MSAYISEVDYEGGAAENFVEIVVPAGTDVSGYSLVVYDKDGSVDSTLSFDPATQTIAGQDVYLFDATDSEFEDLKNDEAVALVDDTGTVLQFISFQDPVTAVDGPANGLSATQIGEHSSAQASLATSDGGASYQPTTTSTPGSVPCFARETLIQTPDGLRCVETLRVGDLVTTMDNGAQPIVWLRQASEPLLKTERSKRPVLIKAQALGPDRPSADLIVSPQHRILLGQNDQLSDVFADPGLTASKALVACSGVRHMMGRKRAEWFHFAFRSHEIVFANGCATESLLLGPMVLAGLRHRERQSLLAQFSTPCPKPYLNGPAARPLLKVQAASAAICNSRSMETYAA